MSRNRVQSRSSEMHPQSALAPNTSAPNFKLHTTPDQCVALSDFRGQPVILAFYPADWSPICGDQMTLYNEILPEFRRYNAELLGISVDGVWCHLAFARDRKLHFSLLSDFEPKGEVARTYGVYRAQDGVTERALFVIDEGGVIRWSYVSPVGINPGADGILSALESFATPSPDLQPLRTPHSVSQSSTKEQDRESINTAGQ
jgi:peroxiredoxin